MIRNRTENTRFGPKPAGTPGVGCGLFGTVFLLAFLGMGLLFFYLIAKDVRETILSYGWHRKDCTIVGSGVLETDDEEHPYRFDVRYRYEEAGKAFTSSVYKRGYSGGLDYQKARALEERYPAGSQAECYADPRNPSEAVLKRRNPLTVLTIFFPLVFVAVGGGGLFILWKSILTGREKKQEAGAAIESFSEKGRKSRFRKLGPIILFLLFTVLGGGIFFGLFWSPIQNLFSSKSWERTPCTVVSSRVRSISDDDGTTYRADILYEYVVRDRTYRSNRYDFLTFSSSGYRGKAALVEQYPPGRRTFCYVNPAVPWHAVIERGFSKGFLVGLIPLIFFLIGVLGIFSSVKTRLREEPAPAPGGRLRALRSPGARHRDPTVRFETGRPTRPAVLTPTAGPGLKFAGCLLACLFWNGIVSVFAWGVIKTWLAGRPHYFETLILTPFVLVGIGAVIGAGYYFLAMWNPRPRLTVKNRAVPLGEPLELDWKMEGRASVIRRLRICLEGREEATYADGTGTNTARKPFARIDIVDTGNPVSILAGRSAVPVPLHSMHTFKAEHNKIVWAIHLHGEIERWPDIKNEFEIEVLPARNGRTGETS
jgi:hypothetical protein